MNLIKRSLGELKELRVPILKEDGETLRTCLGNSIEGKREMKIKP
jgi:hypothetical protein